MTNRTPARLERITGGWLAACLACSGVACSRAWAQGSPSPGVDASRPDAASAASASTAADAAGTPSADAAAAPATTPPYTGPRPYVFLRPPRVSAGLVAEQINRLFRRNQAAVETCYTNQLATNATAHGLATIRVTVIAGGVGTVDSARTSPAIDAFDRCMQDALGGWEWPNPRGQPATQVTMQIDLAPTPPANPRH